MLRSVVEGKDATISKANQQLATLREQVALLTTQRDNLKKEKLAQVDMYTGINREQATHHASEIAERDTTVNTLQSTIDELQDDVAEKQQTIDNYEHSVGLLRNDLNVQRLAIAGNQDTIDSQRAEMQAARSQHELLMEMMVQSRLSTIRNHKALLGKWANTYREGYEHWAVRKQNLKDALEQQRGVVARLQDQVADFQRQVWDAEDTVGQLKADQELTTEILITQYRARIDEHYEGFRARFQQVIDGRNAALGQALTRKLAAQSERYATALADAQIGHQADLAAVRNQFAADIEAARVGERNSLEGAFGTRLQDALRDQSTTMQAQFDTKLAADLQKKETDLKASHAEILTAALEAQRNTLQAQYDTDVKQALETQRLELENKLQRDIEVARARWEKQPAPANTSSASRVLETSPTGAGSSSVDAVTNAAANAVSIVANADAAPVINTAPTTTDAAPETRSDTSPQPRSAEKRPAPETIDQAARRPKRSRVSKSTSELGAVSGGSKSTSSNAKGSATLLWSIF